jgi:hypothetical protein
MSYSIQSFTIQPGDSESQGKCWNFAEYGQSGAVRVSRSVVVALLGTGLAIWLAS